ncbi:MAG: fibrobacter succinogenes major paralogous domain-containing protein [Ignavibacteriales bacterium]|nr:fibrobacter succinogenes major paralogous domain-containing protein [Ignavibacteriales bacterium]
MKAIAKFDKLIILGLLLFVNGCGKEPQNDGNNYKTVKIGNKIWMAENLNVDRFRNGDLISEAKTNEEWAKAGREGKPAWCYYDNDPMNGKKYGKLYNWYAVNDKRVLAPEGWYLSTEEEFENLFRLVKNDGNALKAIGVDRTGTNSSKFSALLVGFRSYSNGFSDLGTELFLWIPASHNNKAYAFNLSYGSNIFYVSSHYKDYGFSVRCIKDYN